MFSENMFFKIKDTCKLEIADMTKIRNSYKV